MRISYVEHAELAGNGRRGPSDPQNRGHPLARWRRNVAPSVIAMAAEMGPDELSMRAVARRMGLQHRVWRVLPKGRANILFLVAANLQTRRTKAVAKHDGLRKRTARARVEAHLARMLAFDFEPGVKEWRRACAAQGWYWTREQQADLFGELPGPSSRLSATWVRPSRPSGASMRAR